MLRLSLAAARAGIPKSLWAEPAKRENLSEQALLLRFAKWARRLADPPVSNFQVGAAVLSGSGRVYLGANVEFPDLPPQMALHAEQSVLAAARQGGDDIIRLLGVTAAPCGHCRQFMQELPQAENLRILIAAPKLESDREPFEASVVEALFDGKLSELLPLAFGPHDLGITPNPLTGSVSPTGAGPAPPSSPDAAYAPYTHIKTLVRLQFSQGEEITGLGIESAAWNPGLLAVISALGSARHLGLRLQDIRLCTLESKRINSEGTKHALHAYRSLTRYIMSIVAPKATFTAKII